MNQYETHTHIYWCVTILTEGKLNQWEEEFINNIKIKLDMNIPINDRQETVLEALYNKVTK